MFGMSSDSITRFLRMPFAFFLVLKWLTPIARRTILPFFVIFMRFEKLLELSVFPIVLIDRLKNRTIINYSGRKCKHAAFSTLS